MNDYKKNYSRRVLIRLVIMTLLALGIVAINLDLLTGVYFRNQLTQTGIIINSSILVLFLLGLSKVIWILLRYMREESALSRFIFKLEQDQLGKPEKGESTNLINDRYRTILNLDRQNAPINHSALAAVLLAQESTRISFPKFIHNILILTGVFGTIISLSIALIGASDMLGSPQEIGNMGLIIHGMSTALSTTITAILCYLFYGYFYLKLTDTQTHLVGGIEQVTTLYLLPRFSHSSDTLLHDIAGLVKSLRTTATIMHTAQESYSEAGSQLQQMFTSMNDQTGSISSDMKEIKQLLQEGFRLPARDDA
ncbi:hypothetical protein BOW53_03270 [Solemya pervernicosa gill symbiont]|uniref:MotA/TolQ/ExbB proton channel domain-containing protein n=2 Tax=Gammaproteobacteria incertae sedis TaxID=118884 RepID=A0A1T2L8W5_9GAMM|nr:hypothetical protein [Candidatus Reidiella endopervernicosa]OOZ41543.1 hypothetical protein BOW53_03270 [Solemya pervernicosa gill symbiont]QKQ27950.1 hypothetical protein HUE57_17920 [Candidatus Reidiella endopervernicosa]